VTNVTEENVTEGVLIREFFEYCEESCDLSEIDLNETNYTLRIEINGEAVVNLDSITYGILFSEDVEKIKKTERKEKRGKRVELEIPEGLENTPIKTDIPKEWNIKDKASLRVYWEEGDEDIEFDVFDFDNDGNIDEVEWVSPVSGNQTFSIIVITKAEHLDSNRSFISNIFEEVRELDGVWSETINDEEYVRVVFERDLTSERDITVYPRTISGSPSIEVYERDGIELIAEFSNLIDDEYNKVFLTNLVGEQDTFDLRVVGGSVEFDHIVDPVIDGIPIQVCDAEVGSLASGLWDVVCDNTYPAPDLFFDDALDEDHGWAKNTWAGVRTNSFDSSITNCVDPIVSVDFCYKWWWNNLQGDQTQTNRITNCDVSVDADGGASYTQLDSICPPLVEPAGITCVDITSIGETWTCSNFFGGGATGALAKSENQGSQSGPGNQGYLTTWDVFYFRVDYTEDVNTAPPPSRQPNLQLPPNHRQRN